MLMKPINSAKTSFLGVVIVAIILFCLGFGLCFTLQQFFALNPGKISTDDPPSQPVPNTSLKDINRHFFNNEFMIYGKDMHGVPFFLKLNLNRKQQDEKNYVHYYFSNFLYGNINKSDYFDFYSDSPDITAQNIFSSYDYQKNQDLSSREKYDFLVTLPVDNGLMKNIAINVAIDELEGDFLIKNSPAYTKHMSIGKAKIVIDDNNSFFADVVVSSIYSDDYSKYIFFQGYDDIHPTTDLLILWDENGSFYLVDHTLTKEQNLFYPPHTWVLYKNSKGFMKKAFEADIDFKEAGGALQWLIRLDDLDFELNVQATEFFKGSLHDGVAQGFVVTPDGTFTIAGFAERHE